MLTPLPPPPAVDPEAEAAFVAAAGQTGITITTEQVERFRRLALLLLDTNTRVNLTAITDYRSILTRHFLDSLTALAALPPAAAGSLVRIIDIGSGAGFPGLPLAMVRDDVSVVLTDSVGKKTAFISAAIAALGLTNATAVTARAEDLAQRLEWRETFDVALGRAVAPLATLLEYLLPLCRAGGRAVALKKGDLAAELTRGARAARLLGGGSFGILPVTLAGLEDDRVVVVVPKERPTPPHYPRRAGVPTRQPLG